VAEPYDIDERLKNRLDTNQLARERLCRGILALDKRFSDVRPRHPRGGPDGGLDVAAMFQGNQVAAGAVGFVDQANDSDRQKRTIAEKFEVDFKAAKGADTNPTIFVFMTNLNLTLGEKEDMRKLAIAAGFTECETFDRERLRIALDNADGFALRFQILGLPLSVAEQATFFAKWGDDIQSLVSTGFQRLERSLDRLLFLSEANDVLDGLYIHFELDRTYDADEIGHFRSFCHLLLREIKHNIMTALFGSTDRAGRFGRDQQEYFAAQRPGIRHGIAGGQWEKHVHLDEADSRKDRNTSGEEHDRPSYIQVGSSSSIGGNEVRFVSAQYSHDDTLIRFRPRLCLKDLDGAGWMPVVNASLAEKIVAIHVYANGYKLDEVRSMGFHIDRSETRPEPIDQFSVEELADPWVRIRPNDASYFQMRFFQQTPLRLFRLRLTNNSLPIPQRSDDSA